MMMVMMTMMMIIIIIISCCECRYMGEDYVSRQDDFIKTVPVIDDYTGQNNFHILIANGAINGGVANSELLFSIVTYEPFRQRLLRGRATGRFFCPYYGSVHLGATPLHFAVLSRQALFVKLIIEKLCQSDAERLSVLWDKDNSGNMVLHLAVLSGNIEIYDYLRGCFLHLEALLIKGKPVEGRVLKSIQSDLYIKNALNITPLELAAALGNCDMLSRMINADVVTIWEYNDFSLKGYAIRDVDTFKTLALDRWQLVLQARVLFLPCFKLCHVKILIALAGNKRHAAAAQYWGRRHLESCAEVASWVSCVARVKELF
jgi:ankyrin repeat protein